MSISHIPMVGATSSPQPSPPRNSVLAALSVETSTKLRNHLRELHFREGDTLWGIGDYMRQAIFPISGTISIRVPTKDGHEIEVATIGRQAAAGFSTLLPTVTQAVVQAPGQFNCISAQAFARASEQNDELRRVVEVCEGWLLLQSQLMAACNATHSADARFCRWLLRASDALGGDVLLVTQEVIAKALGIRRTTVTLIAQQLQMKGAISYTRGRIAVRDHAGLQAAACNCYHLLGRARWPSEWLCAGSADRQHLLKTRGHDGERHSES
jgi:CRP-like cAMP-binding protein